jgi:anaerobic selenocysteine-containing dehydrogenase
LGENETPVQILSERTKRTARSYCRVCTAQCGILVDIEGEDVIAVCSDKEPPVSKGYTCPKAVPLGRCTTIRSASNAR